MSGLLTVNGGYNGTNGLLPVPTKFTAAFGESSIATALQNYLNVVSTLLPAGGASSFEIGFENDDIATGTVYSVSGSGAGALVNITNTDTGGATAPSANVNLTVPSITTTLVVQDPARVSITGSDSTSLALFSGQSTVFYSVTGGQGSIFAGGGRDEIFSYSAGTNSNLDIVSAGNDLVSLDGSGSDTVTAVGNATTSVVVGAGTATVSATGSSLVNVQFAENAGGNLFFVNNSSGAASVYTGSYPDGGHANSAITVFGGGGGGIFVGGRAGNNSLIGGSGLTTMIGGGNNDVISVTASVGSSYNELFTGLGTESLYGGSGSGNNAFNIGLYDPGVGNITATGIASSDGSGTQAFDIGNSNGETLTGSSVAGSTNFFDVIGSSTTGGGNLTINDFNSANSAIYLVDATTQAPSDAAISVIASSAFGAQIVLTDGTSITLKGISTSAVVTSTGSFGETIIK
jgi:hypothetical protein